MKIAIVDDDERIYERLSGYMRELLGGSVIIHGFSSGEEFLSSFKCGAFDIVFLDIFMEQLTGMDVAREIRKTDKAVEIVFSTTSNEYASESYEVNACYYLHKPFGIERVRAMLERINAAELEARLTVKLPDGGSAVLRDIIYADFADHKVTLHLKDGINQTVRAPFAEIEALLCAYPYFISPSKGIIINFHEVKCQNDGTLTMNGGSIVPISRRKAKEVAEAYSSFRFEKLRKGEKS